MRSQKIFFGECSAKCWPNQLIELKKLNFQNRKLGFLGFREIRFKPQILAKINQVPTSLIAIRCGFVSFFVVVVIVRLRKI